VVAEPRLSDILSISDFVCFLRGIQGDTVNEHTETLFDFEGNPVEVTIPKSGDRRSRARLAAPESKQEASRKQAASKHEQAGSPMFASPESKQLASTEQAASKQLASTEQAASKQEQADFRQQRAQKGGVARRLKLTAQQRSDIARKAAEARYGKEQPKRPIGFIFCEFPG
jgi:hypothetical protein